MGVFSIPVTIGVDEERIAKEVAKNAEAAVVNEIVAEVKDIIFTDRGYGARYSNEPLKDMVKDEIKEFMASKEDIIVKEAAKLLADKLFRSKAVKEKVLEVVERGLHG